METSLIKKREWTPPATRITLSEFNTDSEVYLPNPWLSFTLTVAFRHPDAPVADFFFQQTTPGCLFTPFQEGLDGKNGKFSTPTPFSKTNLRVNSVHIGPKAFITGLEEALRRQEDVLIWTKRVEITFKDLGLNPYRLQDRKRLKILLKGGRGGLMKHSITGDR